MITDQSLLCDVLHQHYFPVRLKIRSEHTRDQYRLALRDFAALLGRTACVSDLSDDALTALLLQLLERGLAEITANERVGRLKTLWTWLGKRGHVRTFPTFDRVVVPERIPRAWTPEEMRSLFTAFGWEQGEIGGIPAPLWWQSSHAFLWCTGERKGATFAVEWEMLDLGKGVAVLPPSIRKGRRKAAVYKLWPDVVAMLRQIATPRRSLVWPWPFHWGTYYNRYDRILKRAGLPLSRNSKTQAMRVSHATWLHAQGADATAALKHSSAETTRKSYIDPRYGAEAPNLFRPWDEAC